MEERIRAFYDKQSKAVKVFLSVFFTVFFPVVLGMSFLFLGSFLGIFHWFQRGIEEGRLWIGIDYFYFLIFGLIVPAVFCRVAQVTLNGPDPDAPYQGC